MEVVRMNINPQDQEKIEEIVRSNLSHEPVVEDIRLVEHIQKDGYDERIYVVLWFAEGRVAEHGQYGTHRCNVNNKDEIMLIWGHYDMQVDEARRDFEERI